MPFPSMRRCRCRYRGDTSIELLALFRLTLRRPFETRRRAREGLHPSGGPRVIGLEDYGLAIAADEDRFGLEAKFLGQAHCLAAAGPEDLCTRLLFLRSLGLFHDMYQ